MIRVYNTITAAVFCMLAVLSGAEPLAATEPQDDEKITMPAPVTPDNSGSVIIVPPPNSGRAVILTPPQVTPTLEKPGILPPSSGMNSPVQTSPAEIPVIPVLPDKAAQVEVPVIPAVPQSPEKTLLVTPSLQQETTPQKYDIVTQPTLPTGPEPNKQASPVDFLPMPTPLAPDKAKSEPGTTKDKQLGQARPEKPKTKTPPKVEQAKPKPAGPSLCIPPEAAKAGNLSFLEGCWREIAEPIPITIIWRYCFDKNGNGQRVISDPDLGKCTGAAKGKFDAQGRLIITAEWASCDSGISDYGPGDVVCEGGGSCSPCIGLWRAQDLGERTPRSKVFLVRE